MANVLYNKAKQEFLQAGLDLSVLDLKVAGVNITGGATQYVFSQSHDFFNDIPVGARVTSLSASLASKTFIDGVFDADDLVPAWISLIGEEFEAIILINYTGTDATSNLIAFIDTATGLPLTPNGNNVDLNWNASGIFAL